MVKSTLKETTLHQMGFTENQIQSPLHSWGAAAQLLPSFPLCFPLVGRSGTLHGSKGQSGSQALTGSPLNSLSESLKLQLLVLSLVQCAFYPTSTNSCEDHSFRLVIYFSFITLCRTEWKIVPRINNPLPPGVALSLPLGIPTGKIFIFLPHWFHTFLILESILLVGKVYSEGDNIKPTQWDLLKGNMLLCQ